MPTYYDKICAYEKCQQPFKVLPRRKKQQFCSSKCHHDNDRVYDPLHEHKCFNPKCNVIIKKEKQKFCSSSCSATVNNVGRKRYKKPPNKCLVCENKTGSHRQKYCSRYCASIGAVGKCKNRNKINYNLTCKHCSIPFTNTRQVKYCESCSHLYSHNGRARYWFTINVFKYPELFDLDSLKKVGFRSKENLNGYTRDHKVSVNEAIKNNYDPYYITHVMNCELMLWMDNNKKNTKSSISYDKLKMIVDEYDSISGRGG